MTVMSSGVIVRESTPVFILISLEASYLCHDRLWQIKVIVRKRVQKELTILPRKHM